MRVRISQTEARADWRDWSTRLDPGCDRIILRFRRRSECSDNVPSARYDDRIEMYSRPAATAYQSHPQFRRNERVWRIGDLVETILRAQRSLLVGLLHFRAEIHDARREPTVTGIPFLYVILLDDLGLNY